MPFCPDCGYRMILTDKYCYSCGKKVVNEFALLIENAHTKGEAKVKPIETNKNKLASIDNLSENPSKGPELLTSESEVSNMPYSWNVNNIEITLLGICKDEEYTFENPLSNKKKYELILKTRNLLKKNNQLSKGSFGFDHISLQTDVGNTWNLKGNPIILIPDKVLDPEEIEIRNDLVFEIRAKELPEFLLVGVLGRRYIFDIPVSMFRTNRKNFEAERMNW